MRVRAWLVHLYTAAGVLFSLAAMAECFRPEPDARLVFLFLAIAFVIDSTDGMLARRWQVKRVLPQIDGRKIDDIVDYLNYTFVPLLLVWRMGWVPEPALAFLAPAAIASLLGFANTGAKDEAHGFFLGFPSYWNVYAFYAGLLDPWISGAAALFLAALTIAPVRFVYPSLAPRPWKMPLLAGGVAWGIAVLAAIPTYPAPHPLLLAATLAYPAFYVALSLVLDLRLRRA